MIKIQLIGGTAMISEEMLNGLEIGTVIKSDVPKKKRDYVSYKFRNGKENQRLSFKDAGDTIDWLFIGINFVGEKKFLKCIEKDPVLSLEFRGAPGCFFGEKELSNIARHWFNTKNMRYARSMNVHDVNMLLDVERKPSNRWYTFKNGDYSPESVTKHRTAYEGLRVRHSAYSYSKNELPITPASDIVFIDKPYWLASKTICVESTCAYFGLGEVTKDGLVNMGHSLFKSTGEILGGSNTAYIRSVVYIDPKLFSLVKLNSGVLRLVAS